MEPQAQPLNEQPLGTGTTAPAPAAAALEPDVARVLASRLLSASPTAELAHVVLAFLITIFLIGTIPWGYSAGWALAITGTVVAWLPWRRRLTRSEPSLARVQRGLRERVAINGLLWGLGVAWLTFHADLVHVAIVLVVLAGLAAGGLVTLMADPTAFRILLACVLGPPALALLAGYQSQEHVALGVLIGVFGGFELFVHQRAFEQLVSHERAKLKIRDSEERLRALESVATEAIVLHDGDRILDVNDAFLRMSGYADASEVVGRSILDFCAPGSVEKVIAAVRSGREEPYEAEGLRKDGTTVTGELSGRRARLGGRTIRVTAIRDISAKKRLEEQLQQSQRMEVIGQLAGGLAHDFNNMMTAILASAHLLEDGMEPTSPLQDDVSIITRAARQGAELTRRLLAFSRRQPLDVRKVELAGIANEMCQMARRLVPEDVVVRGETDGLESTIAADPGAIVQILTNLVANARDAMPSGGELKIRVERRVLTAGHCEVLGWGTPGEYVLLSVSDTGVGMSEDVRARVFEPFFTTKPAGEGSGLGMSMVYGLVTAHGAHVDIDSEVGRGTMVRLFFPSVPGIPEEAVAALPAPVRGGTERVLLVEDEEVVRRAASNALEKFGYSVTSAADGAEALRIMTAGARPDIIVADVVMPRLGGPELVKRLKDIGPLPRILFTSGHATKDVAGRPGMDPQYAFLAKPWQVPDLVRKVREVLDAPIA